MRNKLTAGSPIFFSPSVTSETGFKQADGTTPDSLACLFTTQIKNGQMLSNEGRLCMRSIVAACLHWLEEGFRLCLSFFLCFNQLLEWKCYTQWLASFLTFHVQVYLWSCLLRTSAEEPVPPGTVGSPLLFDQCEWLSKKKGICTNNNSFCGRPKLHCPFCDQ